MKLPRAVSGQRLDRAIAQQLATLGRTVSVREVRRALKEGRIRVDGRRRVGGDLASGDESIALHDFVPRTEAIAEPAPRLLEQISVLYEDAELLALNKPSGLATHPLRAHETDTLLNAAVARCSAIATAGPPPEGGTAHRLDIQTSGVVLFGKTPEVWSALRADFTAHRIEKTYAALAHDPERRLADQIIEGAIRKGDRPDRVRVVDRHAPEGQPAVTRIRVRERLGDWAWIEAITNTGRRHQIRAHLAYVGAPLAADPIYGNKDPDLGRLGLHASRITLADGRNIEAPISGTLAAWLQTRRKPCS